MASERTVMLRTGVSKAEAGRMNCIFKSAQRYLVEESEDLSSGVLGSSLFVGHDSSRGGEHHETDLTRRQELGHPFLDLTELDVESWRDDTALVESSVELDDDLS